MDDWFKGNISFSIIIRHYGKKYGLLFFGRKEGGAYKAPPSMVDQIIF